MFQLWRITLIETYISAYTMERTLNLNRIHEARSRSTCLIHARTIYSFYVYTYVCPSMDTRTSLLRAKEEEEEEENLSSLRALRFSIAFCSSLRIHVISSIIIRLILNGIELIFFLFLSLFFLFFFYLILGNTIE